MKVARASRAGFCMGVSLALKKLETALENRGSEDRICTLGPIIHNPQVLERFRARGVDCLDRVEDARRGDFILIRAHGIPKNDEAILRARAARVADATCPKVKKAQLAIADAADRGARLILFGEADHPEVRGLVSYAHGQALVFATPEELDKAVLDPDASYVLAAQTTQDREIFREIELDLAKRLPRLEILRTICDATRMRQEEARELAGKVDIMIVVGGRQSGNTRRLADLASEAGIRTWHVETADELDAAEINPDLVAGLTAGASTPADVIDAVERKLREL